MSDELTERDPACWPTPEQFVTEWDLLPRAEQITKAEILIAAAQAVERWEYETSLRDRLISQFEARALKAEQECRDREATEQDVCARLADAENTLAKVRAVAEEWCVDSRDDFAEALYDTGSWRFARDLRAALDGKP